MNGVVTAYGYEEGTDRLTSYGEENIEYDGMGNPTSYRGVTATWEKGRQLKSYGTNSYKYDENGIRISKTVNGTEHKYTLNGSNVVCEEYGTIKLDYLYDIGNSVCGMRVNNGTTYYFRKNLQGDITAITDNEGNIIAKYRYDAWGKVLSTTGNTEIANLNPFRYRGYYYDAETQLYYLNSRYYDPETCRFINADDDRYFVANMRANRINLFSYCGNNPVCRMDYNGNFWLTLIVAVVTLAYLGNNVVHGVYNQGKERRGYIYNQKEGWASKLWFGFFRSSYNGCGWIATYNAAIMLGRHIDASDIISEYEMTGAVLYGVMGVQPYAITHFFRFRKYKVTVTYNVNKFDTVAKKHKANIIWYWFDRVNAHYVAIKWDGKKFVGYNTFSNSSGPDDWGKSIKAFLNRRDYRASLLISIK